MVTFFKIRVQGPAWEVTDAMTKIEPVGIDLPSVDLIHPDTFVSGPRSPVADGGGYKIAGSGTGSSFTEDYVFSVPEAIFADPDTMNVAFQFGNEAYVITIFASEDGIDYSEVGGGPMLTSEEFFPLDYIQAPPLAVARLVKIVNTSYTPSNPGDPGFPGQPYLPARVTSQAYQVCSWTPLSYAEIQAAYAAAGVSITWGIVGYSDGVPIYGTIYKFPPGVSSVNIPSGKYTCHTEYRNVSVPAQPYMPPRAPVPPTPAQLLYDYQLGWNARANSIRQMQASGTYSFRIPADTIGAVVGLTKTPRQSGFSDIIWGFYVSRGIVRIYEGGTEVESIGAAPNARLALTRRGGNIEYYVGNDLVRTVSNSPDPIMLTASLYSGGDSVDDAELFEFGDGGGEVSFPPMQVFGGDVPYAIGIVTSMPMDAGGYKDPGGGGAVSFRPLLVIGADSSGYADARVVLEPMTVESEALAPEPTYGIGGVVMMPMLAQGSGLTGTIGQGAVAFEPMGMMGADRIYGAAAITMLPATIYAENFTAEDEAVMINYMLLMGDNSGSESLFVVMQSGVGVIGVISVQQLNDGLMPGVIGAATPMLTQAELQAMLTSVMSARGIAAEAASDLSVWAMNMDNYGGTRYDSYNFNSFAKIGHTYYGANSDGLFELSGPDDDGEDVVAEVNFGNLKFGTTARKAMPYCYVGVASNGRLVLKVEADGETYYYDVRDYDELLEMQRFELGRGLRAVYYNFTLQNFGGSAFDLASIEFTPLPLNRRL